MSLKPRVTVKRHKPGPGEGCTIMITVDPFGPRVHPKVLSLTEAEWEGLKVAGNTLGDSLAWTVDSDDPEPAPRRQPKGLRGAGGRIPIPQPEWSAVDGVPDR